MQVKVELAKMQVKVKLAKMQAVIMYYVTLKYIGVISSFPNG
jgi:hypothetical protein